MWNGVDEAERDSLHLYELCSEVGMTPDQWKLRIWHMDYLNSLFSLEGVANFESEVDYVFHALMVGSSAEGVGLERLGSDYNIMMTVTGTRLAPHRHTDGLGGECHIFRTIQTYHPLYVRLQCVYMGTGVNKGIMPTPSCCIGDEQGRMVLSGKLLMDAYSHTASGNVNAPAISAVLRGNIIKPILCIHSPVWPLAAREWAFRVRRFVWPSVELKKLILQHGCHVVPKGNPQSPNKHFEWRWSFSLAEKMLVRTFNIIQLQCYFLLKMVVIFVINPMVLNGISSYQVKTVMLHMVENTHPTEWTKEKLAPCFSACLAKLLQCVEDGSCPHYFVPSYNLFALTIQGDTRIKLVTVISGLLEKDWKCVLQCLPPNMNMLLARHKMPTRCDCYDMHWGLDRCDTNVSMVERSYTLFNATIRVILRLTERPDLQTTTDAITMFLDYPAAKDNVHFPDSMTAALVKQTIKSHLGYCYLGLSQTYPYNRKQSDDAKNILEKGMRILEDSLTLDAVSTKLKMATLHFMLNKTESCIKILMQLIRQYNEYIVNTTGDKTRRLKSPKRSSAHRRHRSVTSLLGKAPSLIEWASLEICFSPWEIPFAPEAIQMLQDREPITDDDTDYKGFVFVDAIVYAYFLLILSYNNMHRPVHR